MTPRVLKWIAEIDEFKGYWNAMGNISSETLSTLRVLATIESIGSSTRIEGARLSDSEVSALLEGLDVRSFRSRDEQEVAGYAKARLRKSNAIGSRKRRGNRSYRKQLKISSQSFAAIFH
jgi:hypothetical protein